MKGQKKETRIILFIEKRFGVLVDLITTIVRKSQLNFISTLKIPTITWLLTARNGESFPLTWHYTVLKSDSEIKQSLHVLILSCYCCCFSVFVCLFVSFSVEKNCDESTMRVVNRLSSETNWKFRTHLEIMRWSNECCDSVCKQMWINW
jgi:hypothetical protein